MGAPERVMPSEVVDYLRLHHVITVSTSSFTGMPHADTTVYVNDDRRLFFFGTDGSPLVRNVRDSRFVSFTIDDYTTDWRKVRELQGVCGCHEVPEEERAFALGVWMQKYGHRTPPQGRMYALTPREMHFIDYDYATIAGDVVAEIQERSYQLTETSPPTSAPVSTTLDQSSFSAGQVIFRPGESTGQYFVVLDGEVEIRSEGFGSDQTVTRVGPGQMFGDRATLLGQRGALTAHAVTSAVLLAVQREAIRDLLLPDQAES